MHLLALLVIFAGMANLMTGGETRGLTRLMSPHSICTPKEQEVLCKCDKTHTEFNLGLNEFSMFAGKSAVFITDCASATLHFYLFERAFEMKNLYIERIKKVDFGSQLPPGIENIVIKNVGLVENILIYVLLTHPTLSTFSITNTTIGLIEMDIFTDVSVKKINFEEVIFQNITYSSKYAPTDYTNTSESVIFKDCHFKSLIPSYALQFKVKNSYKIINCNFAEPLRKDAIHASTTYIDIQNNIFNHLDQNSIAIHHHDNQHRLQVNILNNTIKSMDKNAIFFPENLIEDISQVTGNTISCNGRPQCDDRTAWLLNALGSLVTFQADPRAMCEVLATNQCKDTETGRSLPVLIAFQHGRECMTHEVTLMEKILEDCTDKLEILKKQHTFFKTEPNTAQLVTSTISLVLFWLIQLWVL